MVSEETEWHQWLCREQATITGGIAIDIANASGPRLAWLAANATKFGFSWEVLPSEPWHLRYVAGDDVPEAVKAWKANRDVVHDQ